MLASLFERSFFGTVPTCGWRTSSTNCFLPNNGFCLNLRVRIVNSPDIVNGGGLQLIYLCKIWHNKDVTGAAKAFTMVSVITSGLCSLAGPLAALFQYYMLSDAAKAAEGNGDRQKELKRKNSLGPRRRRKLSRGGEWEDTTTDQEDDNW